MDAIELDRLIEQRAVIGDDAAEREEGWKRSVRNHNAAREAELRAEWAAYYRTLAAVFARYSEENRRRAERME